MIRIKLLYYLRLNESVNKHGLNNELFIFNNMLHANIMLLKHRQ
jgi:hypothetical protein